MSEVGKGGYWKVALTEDASSNAYKRPRKRKLGTKMSSESPDNSDGGDWSQEDPSVDETRVKPSLLFSPSSAQGMMSSSFPPSGYTQEHQSQLLLHPHATHPVFGQPSLAQNPLAMMALTGQHRAASAPAQTGYGPMPPLQMGGTSLDTQLSGQESQRYEMRMMGGRVTRTP